MTTPLSANYFFDLTDFEHRDLFDDGYVWGALARLKDHMASLSYIPLPEDIAADRPLERTIIFHEGDFFEAEGLDVVYGNVTKGELLVKAGDRILEGASVIMAGAVLQTGRLMI